MNPKIEKYLKECLGYERKTLATIKTNEDILEDFYNQFTEMNEKNIKTFILKGRKDTKQEYTKNSINTILTVFRKYLTFYGQKKLAKSLHNVKPEKKIVEALTIKQTQTLLGAVVQKKAWNQKRNQLLLAFLYSTGVRVSEAIKMDQKDLYQKEGIALVRGGKESKDRFVNISKEWIKTYQSLYGELKDKTPLFVSQNGGRLSDDMIRKIVKMASQQTGVLLRGDRFVHPHKLRTTHITHLSEQGENPFAIKEEAGHEKFETTLKYIQPGKDKIKKIKNPLDTLMEEKE